MIRKLFTFIVLFIGIVVYRRWLDNAHKQIDDLSTCMNQQSLKYSEEKALFDFEMQLSEIRSKYSKPHLKWAEYIMLKKDTFALRPPMGWNSWDCYGAAVNEEQLMGNAEYMAKYLKDYGWQYVSKDNQKWQLIFKQYTNPRTIQYYDIKRVAYTMTFQCIVNRIK